MVKTRKCKFGDSGLLIYYAVSINQILKDPLELRKLEDADSTIFRNVGNSSSRNGVTSHKSGILRNPSVLPSNLATNIYKFQTLIFNKPT